MKIKLPNFNFKRNQLVLLVIGVLCGFVLCRIIMHNKIQINIIELDLNKIIKIYAQDKATTTKPVATLEKDFKQKFYAAIDKLFPNAIIVNKKNLLSKHQSIDYTKEFIEELNLNE